jgi:copper(I)-binding protein
MTFLRTAIVILLNVTVHAQPSPTATDATAVIVGDRAAIFATIANPTMYDVYIVSGKSDSAMSVDFVDGKEEKVVSSLTVPAFGSLMLQPTLARVRLHGLKNQLKVGDELTLTLETDGGVGIPIAAIVKATNQ